MHTGTLRNLDGRTSGMAHFLRVTWRLPSRNGLDDRRFSMHQTICMRAQR